MSNQLRQLAADLAYGINLNTAMQDRGGGEKLQALREYLRLHPDNDSAEKFYEMGEWAATTLGGYVKMLIDNAIGSGDIVLMRVEGETMHNEAGEFARLFEVVLIPRNQGLDHILAAKVTQIHRDLQAEIDAGLVK